MASLNLPRTLMAVLAAVTLGAAWFVLAPPQLGGKTRLVVTSGSSMEPKIHRGDLALIREGGDPAVGDVILYSSHDLQRSVLHRIVARDGGAFVMKGDNNDFRDGEHPTAGQVQGKLWIVLPGIGRVIGWLRQPVNLAIVLFLLVFASMAGGRQVSRRRVGPTVRPLLPEKPLASREPSDTVIATARGALVPAGAGLALFSLLAVLAWSTSDVRTVAQPGGYSHTGAFAYSAKARPSTVYPTGRVETGDAAFVKLVRRLSVSFTYRFDSSLRSDVRGGIVMDARISDGAGWSRVIPVAPVKPFNGPVARADGVLDLARLEAMGARMRELTSSGTTSFIITLQPRVDVAGYAGSSVVDEPFVPELRFNLDTVSLRLDVSGDAQAELTPRAEGTTTVEQRGRLALGPVSLPVSETRVFAAVGIAVTLLMLVGAAALLARRGSRSEDERIAARYGSRIVRASTAIPEGRWITDVPDIESLVRLAQHYDRVILLTGDGRSTTYLVDDGVAVYRFRAGPDTASPSRVPSLPGA